MSRMGQQQTACNTSKSCRALPVLCLLLLLAMAARSLAAEATAQQAALLPNQAASATDTAATNTAPLTCWGWTPSCIVTDTTKPVFAFIGDSITTFGFNETGGGWAIRLFEAYSGGVHMVNYGIEGATTRRVDEAFAKLTRQLGPQLTRVKLATVFFGTNDAVLSFSPKWHVPRPVYKENLKRLVLNLQDSGVGKVVLIGPPPVGRRGDRKNNETEAYAETVCQLAKELELGCVNTFKEITALDDWQKTAIDYDQLHLSPIGQEAVYKGLLKLLSKSPDVSPAAMAKQQQQQLADQQQSRARGSGGVSSVMVLVVGVVGVLLFFAIVMESKQRLQRPAKLAA